MHFFKKFFEDNTQRYIKGFKGSFFGIISRFTNLFSGIIIAPILIDYVGEERFGLWLTITSILGLLIISDFGLGNSLVNKVSSKLASKEFRRIATIISSVFFFLIFVSLFFLLIFFFSFSSVDWSSVFGVKNNEVGNSEVRNLFFILFLLFILNITINLISNIQLSFQEVHKTEIVRTVGYIFGLIYLLTAVTNNLDLHLVLLGYTGIPILFNSLNFIYFSFYDKRWARPRMKYFDISELKDLAKTGLIFTLINISHLISMGLDTILIARNFGLYEVSIYGITRQIFSVLYFVPLLAMPFWPAFSEALANREFNWVKKTYFKLTILTTSITIAFCILFSLFGKIIINFWVGESLIPSNLLIFSFSIYWIAYAFSQPGLYLMQTDGFKNFLLLLTVIFCIFILILKILFIKELGISGVVLINCLGYIFFLIIPVIIYLRRKLTNH